MKLTTSNYIKAGAIYAL